jgi:hypothetical protein
MGETLSHHQDERTISAYLTFFNPEKYTFYKSSFYKAFCDIIGVKPAKKNQKYSHYLEILYDFINEHIVNDTELIEMVKEFLPAYYDGTNHLLLAQDILYNSFDGPIENQAINYKKQYTFWLEDNNSVGSNKSNSYLRAMDLLQENVDFTIYETNDIEVLSNLYSELISSQRDEESKYYNSEAPSYGKNGYYSATINSYIEFHKEMTSSVKNDFQEFIKKFDDKELATYFNFLRDIIRYHGLAFGDQRLTFNYYDQRIVLSVGQKYTWCLVAKNEKGKFLVLAEDKIAEATDTFEKAWLNYFNEWNPSASDLESIHNGIAIELAKTKKSGYRKHNKEDFEAFIFNHKLSNIKPNKMKTPLNQILYGPPGTGKTYRLKNEYFPKYTSSEISISPEKNFENVVKECSWWQVIAIALLELGRSKVSEIHTSRWVAKKDELSNSKTVRPTLWGQLQAHTIDECEFVNVSKRQNPQFFKKAADSSWEIIPELVEELAPELNDIIDSVNNFNPSSDKEIKRYVFTTFHQSFSYEDFIEGIKPVMLDEGVDELTYQIEPGVFKKLCTDALNDPENQYAIFIDEINRGNLSSIFGELITLIEDDKRKGAANEMSAELPYSKSLFSVPSNVDIYGTMNTADRSVEALDTALRRRFSFVEMLPDPKLLKQSINGISLNSLLSALNERIEVLVDRDHTIGHAFFINNQSLDDLRSTFADKVIPLLQEYFYGDYAKMELVIGSAFFKEPVDVSKVKFAVKNHDFDLEGKVYHIKDVNDKSNFSDAAFIAALENCISVSS